MAISTELATIKCELEPRRKREKKRGGGVKLFEETGFIFKKGFRKYVLIQVGQKAIRALA